jgi:flagellar hook-associated protein 3 FlgL
MRVSDKMGFDQVSKNIAKNRSEMSQLQNQAATQKRVTKPSDDPVAASRVLFSRTEQRGNDQYIKNLNYARSFLDFTEQSLGEVSDLLVRAKELALSQSNDASSNSQSKKIVAAEISQLHDQAVQVGNRKLGERYIFGGYKTTTAPFEADGQYNGDSGELKIHIDKDAFLAMNVPGDAVFQGRGLSKDGYSSKSIQQARTTNELNQQKLDRDSQAEPEVSQKANQSVDSQMRGPASLRGPESLRAAERNIHDRTATGVATGGEDAGINIFKTVKGLETSLMADDKEGVQDSLNRLDDALQQVVLARTQLGSRVMAIDNSLNALHSQNVDMKGTISQLEDVDAFEVISDINKNESTLQATLQTSGKMIQKSLMDFLG